LATHRGKPAPDVKAALQQALAERGLSFAESNLLEVSRRIASGKRVVAR
jgi:hypothetical protein